MQTKISTSIGFLYEMVPLVNIEIKRNSISSVLGQVSTAGWKTWGVKAPRYAKKKKHQVILRFYSVMRLF
jgi:hypothetical protein